MKCQADLLEGTEVRREEIGSGRAPRGRSMRTEWRGSAEQGREGGRTPINGKMRKVQRGADEGGKNH